MSPSTKSVPPAPSGSVRQIDRRLKGIESELARLAELIGMRDARITELERHQATLHDAILGRFPARAEAALPRPLRVVRKRLRSLGIWPRKSGMGVPTLPVADVLQQARRLAPQDIASFFDVLPPYAAWQAANRRSGAAEADLRSALAASNGRLPRISIVTPVHNTPPRLLTEMVASVTSQVYEEWELCLADDASTSPETLAILNELGALDSRIKMVRLDANLGISGATNAAAALATGEVLAFVDHDDLITWDCLAEVALYYAAHPDADLVYSDDDKIDDQGRRYAPQFKPDWSPSLLTTYMYMSHVLTVRRDLFEKVGGFRTDFDGSQDYDFALRATERARQVGHIPKILYHWRATEGSTALSGAAKPASFDAGRRAVQQALDRRGLKAEAVHPDWAMKANVGMYGIRFPDTGPHVTIIVPTYNKHDLLSDCLSSLEKTSYENFDVLVVDNGSDDPASIQFLQQARGRPRTSILRIERRPEGFSFSALMNEAVRHARGEFLLFLNNDTAVIEPRWLSQMVGRLGEPGVGSVGARLYFEDQTIQHAGVVHGLNEGLVGHAFRHLPPHDWGYMGFVRSSREYSAVTAACMLTSRATFAAVGGFDEKNFAVAYNDVDYCYRLVQTGYRNVYCPDAELFHFEGKTRGQRDNPREVVALRRLYGNWRDPWYNRNLSLENERFEPAPRAPHPRSGAPIRALIVSHNLNFEGAPNTLFDLVVGLKNEGIVDPVVLSPLDGPLRRDYEAAGIQVELFTPPSVGSSATAFRASTAALASRIRLAGAQCVIANTLTMFFAVNAAAEAGVASIWCQHESEPWETYFDACTPEIRSYAYAAFGQSYRVTYVADATRRAWSGVQTRGNAQVIRHGIPPKRLREELGRWTRSAARHHLQVDTDEIVVILMGTVCRRKGQMDMVEALRGANAQLAARLRVYIVGALAESDYVMAIDELRATLPHDLSKKVVITGSAPDMSLYYAAADISVCTSRIESAPRVIVESMAFGLPIVTTPVFGIPELVDRDVNALFYEPGEVGVLLGTLDRLAHDNGERARLALASQDVLDSRPGYADMLGAYSELVREASMIGETPNTDTMETFQ